jgi:hypothetical protein
MKTLERRRKEGPEEVENWEEFILHPPRTASFEDKKTS